jgi:membrane-bound lytic murein transglycosylase B
MKPLLPFLCLLMFSGLSQADYIDHPKSEAFIDKMVREHQFERETIVAVLQQAEQKESILKAIAKPAEKRLDWAKYSDIFLTEKRIKNGKVFLEEYADVFARAEAQFGVPREIIAAIIGVETRYGKNKGSYRVVDALATLGFDYPPRAKFFLSELEQMFLLAREQGFEPLDLVGSYAGAMGYGQFISSSYRHYAVDFDGDGVADILSNPVDAIGSVANYFKQHKWRSGQAVARRAEFKGEQYTSLVNDKLKPSSTLGELKSEGLQGFADLPDDYSAKIQLLQGKAGKEEWVTLHNFYVITRYNHSHLYAMAVYQLAQEFGLD